MRTPSSQTCRLDLAPPLADRFILGFPIDYGPVLLLMPFRFHLAVDTLPSGVLQSGGSRSVLAISSFRLRARLDVFIPSTLSGQRGYEPRFWIWRPSFERQRDFNPPEQCAAQRTCPGCRQHNLNSEKPMRDSLRVHWPISSIRFPCQTSVRNGSCAVSFLFSSCGLSVV
jgi:hypothetical protein